MGRWLGSLAALALILWLVPLSAIGQARVLPFWLWAAPTALGAAVGLVLSSKSRRSQPRWLVRAGVGVVLLGLIGGWGLGSVVDLARLSLGGLEAQTQWPAYEELATALADLEPGRVHWEDGEVWSEFGGGWTPAALPHFSEQATLGGLLAHGSPVGAHWLFTARQASSAPREAGLVDLPTEPTLDLEAAAVSMRKLGVRYYVAHSDRSLAGAADAAELTEVATTARFTIFEVAGHGLIAPAIEPPSVLSEGDWKDAAWDWFTGDDERWLVRSVVPEAVGSAVPVITLNRDEIVVDGAEPGVPYLIRVSYWPGWRVEGGDGPFEVAPSFMVVVPTQERFTLIYRPTAADYAGWGVSLLTAIGLLGGVAVGRRRREGSPPTAP